MGRLPAIVHALYQDTPMLQEHVDQIEATPVAAEDILRVHSDDHLHRLREATRIAQERNQIVGLDTETLVSPASQEAAFASAGCVLTGARMVLAGEAPTAFALSRPPGHHATQDTSMGFCLLNNVAIAARWLRAHGVNRVLIVDWDVHHGNGTQDIFYNDPFVYYLSLHQYPLYPGTGWPEERGTGAAANTTRNVQVRAGTAAAEYIPLFRSAIDAALDEFAPEFVLVSAGFDCLRQDPLGGLLLEPADLHAVTRLLMERTAKTAGGRVVHALEGGYNPPRVGAGVVDVVRATVGLPPL